MSIAAILKELEVESATTRRVLERVPADKLSWKPHPKSMSLGKLAMHVATSPGYIAAVWAAKDVVELGGRPAAEEPAITSTEQIVAAHDASMRQAREAIAAIGDEGMGRTWKAVANGATVFEMPRAALVRSIVMNHTYHHRGQLSVYLRLLDVPVPSIYGPSADEQPRMAAVEA